MRFVWAGLMVVLPAPLRRELGRRLLGWDIHPTAYIGRSVILVRHLAMGPGASIGPRNVIRNLELLRLEEGASIATRNHIIGWPLGSTLFPHSPNRDPSLIVGRHAMITVGHEIDCCDRVEIGDYSALAGFNSQILTHSLNLVRDRQEARPVVIGDRSAVMSACILQSGARVPSRSIVSAGSVVTTKLKKELTLYRGNPAEPVRALPETLQYFLRGTPGHHAYESGRLPHQL
jgi:acetyltransferase-like isoleucine patch superfamily enzyme